MGSKSVEESASGPVGDFGVAGAFALFSVVGVFRLKACTYGQILDPNATKPEDQETLNRMQTEGTDGSRQTAKHSTKPKSTCVASQWADRAREIDLNKRAYNKLGLACVTLASV